MQSTTNLKGNVWKTHLYQALLQSDNFYLPIIVLFWQAHDLTLSQIAILQSIFAIALFAFDLPSGYIADQWGRKKSLVTGAIAVALSMGVYIFASTFAHFVLSELLAAIGLAFISGADSALLYDTMSVLGRKRDYKRAWGASASYRLLAMAAFSIIGPLTVSTHVRMPFYIATLGMALLVIVAIALKEPDRKRAAETPSHLTNIWARIKYCLAENPRLRWLIIFTSLPFAFLGVGFWFFQPYFELIGVPLMYFGLLYAGFNVLTAFCARYAHAAQERLGKRTLLIGAVLLLGLSYILLGQFLTLAGLVFIFTQQLVRGVKESLFSDYLNEQTNSEIRATVLSTQSSLGTLFYAAMLPLFGMLADAHGVPFAFTAMGVGTLVVGILPLMQLKKYNVI